MSDDVNHPQHYNSDKSGVETITVSETLPHNFSRAVEYIWRRKRKGTERKDLEKALWYLERSARFSETPDMHGPSVPILMVLARSEDELLKNVILAFFANAAPSLDGVQLVTHDARVLVKQALESLAP